MTKCVNLSHIAFTAYFVRIHVGNWLHESNILSETFNTLNDYRFFFYLDNAYLLPTPEDREDSFGRTVLAGLASGCLPLPLFLTGLKRKIFSTSRSPFH